VGIKFVVVVLFTKALCGEWFCEAIRVFEIPRKKVGPTARVKLVIDIACKTPEVLLAKELRIITRGKTKNIKIHGSQ